MGEITIRQPHAVLRLRVHPRRESAAIPPTQLPDLVERADFCEKVRAARSAFVAHHRRAIKRVLCEGWRPTPLPGAGASERRGSAARSALGESPYTQISRPQWPDLVRKSDSCGKRPQF